LFLTKRVYEPPARSDGVRILIDRLWPRGLRRELAQIDEWLRDLAPSTELRRWYGHDPAKFPQFREQYRAELLSHPDEIADLARRGARETITLLFAAAELRYSNARVLQELLMERAAAAESTGTPPTSTGPAGRKFVRGSSRSKE